MQITPHIHSLTIPFTVPAPSGPIPRSANVFFVCADKVTLIDTGVAGAEEKIFAYLRSIGRTPEEISLLLLTHSHPDHIGAARAIMEATGCRVAAHGAERSWVEDTGLQERERPVPGFQTLVGGPVPVTTELADGDLLDLGSGLHLEALHTPGHSAGSLSFWAPAEKTVITGDAVPLPGDMPIFDDWQGAVDSLERLRALDPQWLLSAWDEPRQGDAVQKRLDEGLAWLRRIRAAVREIGAAEPMELCRRAVAALELPPFAANPLVARSFMSCL